MTLENRHAIVILALLLLSTAVSMYAMFTTQAAIKSNKDWERVSKEAVDTSEKAIKEAKHWEDLLRKVMQESSAVLMQQEQELTACRNKEKL